MWHVVDAARIFVLNVLLSEQFLRFFQNFFKFFSDGEMTYVTDYLGSTMGLLCGLSTGCTH